MSNQLDKRLNQILNGPYYEELKDWRRDIKQAFIDDGWVHLAKTDIEAAKDAEQLGTAIQLKQGYMTGQEWYDKFMELMVDIRSDRDGSILKWTAYQVAKKASGIES